MKVKILYLFTSAEGPEYDDEENFVGIKTITKLEEVIVEPNEVNLVLMRICETSADYGDGITNAKVLCVVDAETNETLPKDIRYWEPSDDIDDYEVQK